VLADSHSAAGSGTPLVQIQYATPVREEYPWLHRRGWQVALIAAGLVVLGILLWQAFYTNGSPDPTTTGTSKIAAVVETAHGRRLLEAGGARRQPVFHGHGRDVVHRRCDHRGRCQ
jgi:hypothetical protein